MLNYPLPSLPLFSHLSFHSWLRKNKSMKTSDHFWFNMLQEVIKVHNMTLDVDNIKIENPNLGGSPTNRMAQRVMEAEKHSE
jgi:hypothetical protein